jgi:hypothetical protein
MGNAKPWRTSAWESDAVHIVQNAGWSLVPEWAGKENVAHNKFIN